MPYAPFVMPDGSIRNYGYGYPKAVRQRLLRPASGRPAGQGTAALRGGSGWHRGQGAEGGRTGGTRASDEAVRAGVAAEKSVDTADLPTGRGRQLCPQRPVPWRALCLSDVTGAAVPDSPSPGLASRIGIWAVRWTPCVISSFVAADY